MPLARDPHDHLVQMPATSRTGSPLPQLPGEQRAELGDPAPDRFVGDVETPLCEHVLDIAEAEREPQIEPDCVPNDGRREAMTVVGGAPHPALYPKALRT